MNKFKIRTVLAFTLVIFVVSLCVPSIFGKAPQRGRRPMLQNQTRAKLHAPDLTDVQKEQLKNLHLELNELKKDTAANAVKIEKIQDEIFNLRIEQMKNAYLRRKEIKKVFTPEQLEKMSALRTRLQRGRAVMNRRMPQRNQSMRRGQQRGRGQMFGRRSSFRRGIIWRR